MPAVLDPTPAVSTPHETRSHAAATRARVPWLRLAALIVAAAGIALRVCHWAAFSGRGFDEALYAEYLSQVITHGLTNYPAIVDSYLEYQKTLVGSILPPTRFLYIFCAFGWHEVFGSDPKACFYAVSRLFGVGSLVVAGLFARRLLPDRRMALGVFALMAFSPLQIHLSQHALVDGFFEFFVLLTLWALWECLHQPGHRGWLATYAAGLACMVTTKENAFFVFVAILALLAANRFLRFGTVSRTLLVMTLVGPLVGVAILTNIAGGLDILVNGYRLGVQKNMHLDYAIRTGDGPWFRYLIDLMAVSPLVLVLACGMIFQLRRNDRPLWFGFVFIVASYVLMANVKYGMNLRYATIWDFPLRVLAMGQVGLLAARAGNRREMAAWTAAVVCLCTFDLSQYYRLAVEYRLYELVPAELMRALKMIK